jgi:hypothetical protein
MEMDTWIYFHRLLPVELLERISEAGVTFCEVTEGCPVLLTDLDALLSLQKCRTRANMGHRAVSIKIGVCNILLGLRRLLVYSRSRM